MLFQKADISKGPRLHDLPPCLQTTDYTCGPSILTSILWSFRIYPSLEDVTAKCRPDPEDGTEMVNLVHVAGEFGVKAGIIENTTQEMLFEFIDQEIPVIIFLQAWGEDAVDYESSYENGHYVGAIGYDETFMYFRDPLCTGPLCLSKEEFVRRWHGEDGRYYQSPAIVVLPPEEGLINNFPRLE